MRNLRILIVDVREKVPSGIQSQKICTLMALPFRQLPKPFPGSRAGFW
jgi:hypothetical protein